MGERSSRCPPADELRAAGWLWEYPDYVPSEERVRESLCVLGNGLWATRGAAPECAAGPAHYPGTYLAGCYDRRVSDVEGHRLENEDLVNLPNWLPLRFRVHDTDHPGDWFTPDLPSLVDHRTCLDLRRGLLIRHLTWRDPLGRTVRLEQRRLVHMGDPHLAGLSSTLLAEDWAGTLEVESALDGRVTNAGVERYRALEGRHLGNVHTGQEGEDLLWLEATTIDSGVRVAQAARTRVVGGNSRAGPEPPPGRGRRLESDRASHTLLLPLRPGRPVTVEKIVALFTSRDRAVYDPRRAAVAKAADAPDFATLAASHAAAWERLWRHSEMSADGRAGPVLRLHTFHLLQTLSPHTGDLDVGVPARGLHGEAYRGHVFWDELFVLPFLDLRFPEVSRAVLDYRWRRLPQACAAARRAGLDGAMYPWQSGSDGREESQSRHLNPASGRWLPDHSRLQRHVGSAIAYNVWRHAEATGDEAFRCGRGGEMLLLIARFWASAAVWDPAWQRYRFRGVVGPDEYHDGYPDAPEPGVDDNAYTNVTAVWVLCRALELARSLARPQRHDLLDRLGVTPGELARWEEISRRVHVPFHDGVISQFEGYHELAELDWEDYRRRYGSIRRLDRVLEAEGDQVRRYRAAKQADVLMLGYLFSPSELVDLFGRLGHRLDDALWRRTVEYYLRRTSHGSTLSAVVHAWVLARTHQQDALRYFAEALEGDVTDVQGGTTAEGIHLGAMGGTLDLLQRGLLGLQVRGRTLRIDPVLAAEAASLGTGLCCRGRPGVTVALSGGTLRIALAASYAEPLRVEVADEVFSLRPGHAVEWALPSLEHGARPGPRPARKQAAN